MAKNLEEKLSGCACNYKTSYSSYNSYKIADKKILAPQIKEFLLYTPEIAEKARAGQFVILRIDEEGERIPLTIADYDASKGTTTIVFQEVGKTTKQLGMLEKDETILDVVGPLGKSSHIEKLESVVMIGGGVGIAPIYPIAKSMHDIGNKVISIIGARNKELLIWEDKMKSVSDEIYVTTDDGSYGQKGFVSQALESLIKKSEQENKKIDIVYAIGPVVMMRAVCNTTKPYNLKTIISLNPIMVDGTGMCGSCRVEVGGLTKFVCVDGPEFNGHEVNFEQLLARQQAYLDEEKAADKIAAKTAKKKGKIEAKCEEIESKEEYGPFKEEEKLPLYEAIEELERRNKNRNKNG